MKNSFLTIAALLLCLAADAQTGPKPAQRLQQEYPKVEWNPDSAITADIDCDGHPDTFFWGTDPAVDHTYLIHGKNDKHTYPEIKLGFEFGNTRKPQSLNIPFFKNTGYYGFRTTPQQIDVQPLSCEWEGRPLPGCVANDRCQSLWIRDNQGFEAFVFWDAERKQISWVRH